MKNHQQKDQLCRKQKHQQIPFSDKVLILSNAFAALRTLKKIKQIFHSQKIKQSWSFYNITKEILNEIASWKKRRDN